MENELMLSIANEYWPFPAGRVAADGDYNGEEFRKKHLVPLLIQAEKQGTKLVVSLDGLKSCGSSFLESAFGGLVRYDGYDQSQLRKILEIVCTKPSLERYKIAILRYIDRAKPN